MDLHLNVMTDDLQYYVNVILKVDGVIKVARRLSFMKLEDAEKVYQLIYDLYSNIPDCRLTKEYHNKH